MAGAQDRTIEGRAAEDRATGGRADSTMRVVLVANARMPSERAQSAQLARAALGYREAGAEVRLIHARRRGTPSAPDPEVLARLAGRPVGDADGVRLQAAPCVDTIDLVPRSLQFVPARAQEWTFGRSATRLAREEGPGTLLIVRDVEVAARLAGRPGTAWEVHRVPGGRHRRGLARRAIDSGMGCIAISRGVADDLAELGATPGQVLVEHDAFDPAALEGMPERAEAREALGLTQGSRVVLYFGGLLRWKGVDVLVDAVRGGHLPGAVVVIAGGMRADVEALRASAGALAAPDGPVRIEGFRPAAEVPRYLAAADVTVVPNRRTPRISSHYTSPLKVFEAMGAGVPMVASDLPSLRDAAGDDGALFVTPEDPAALGAGVLRVLSEPDLRERLVTAGTKRAKDATWAARARRIMGWMKARDAR